MPQVPAICHDCGGAFPSGIVLENSRNIRMRGNTSGPCPYCGGMGAVPDGSYDAIGPLLRLLVTPGTTEADLHQLADVARSGLRRHASAQSVAREINERSPGFGFLRRYLPSDANRLAAYLQLIISVITLLLAWGILRGRSDVISPTEMEEILQRLIEQLGSSP